MTTYIKELPSQDWLNENYCIIDNYVCWKEKIGSRGRKSVRAGNRVTNYIDESGYVRISLKRQTYQSARIIYHMVYGDLTPEFEIDHIDKNKQNNSINNLRKVPQGINKRNKPRQKNASSENTGVCLCRKKHPKPNDHKISEYWVARWYDINGKLKGKNFSVKKLGFDKAYSEAVTYRISMINQVNTQGAGYTEDHGK